MFSSPIRKWPRCARPVPPRLFIFGVGTGRTTVAALDAAGGVVAQFDVTVQPSNFGATQAEAEIHRILPRSHVRVRALPTGLMLSGTVESPADAAQAVAVAKAYATDKQTVENQIAVRSSVQITLQVRIAEMSRTLTRGLGIDWQALGNIGQIGKLPALAPRWPGRPRHPRRFSHRRPGQSHTDQRAWQRGGQRGP